MAEQSKSDKKKVSQLHIMRAELDNEYSTFEPHYRDLGSYILPRRPRFLVSDTNKGDNRNTKINESTATMAAKILRSGMMGGISNPARPWFALRLADPALNEQGPVKEWLHDVTERMRSVFIRSNLYNVLPIAYGDLGVFGTAAIFMEEDLNGGVVRFTPLPIGSYRIANNKDLKVDKLLREFRMTVRQIVEKFATDEETGEIDWSKISNTVKDLYNRGTKETWVDICHMIIPNPKWDPRKAEAKYKRYSSIYFEKGASGSGSYYNEHEYLSNNESYRILRESGFDYFPGLCPRWEICGEDTYATDCPGMTALPDIKQLQIGEKRSLQAIEKMIMPPMVGPAHLRNTKASILPGDITYTDEREGQKGFRSAHETRFDIQALELKQEQVRQRINQAFYVDLFRMLSTDNRNQRATAREIEEMHEEKLLVLGPVLEQLNQDLFDPLIDNTFNFMAAQGLIPPPPPGIEGAEMKVEYISIMAQAQKLVGISGLERASGYVTGLATIDPKALDKFDIDKAVEHYGDMTGLPPGIIRSQEEANMIRKARQEQQQRQMLMENAQNLAQASKTASDQQIQEQDADIGPRDVTPGAI